tara:strand:+ start:3840 stop:4814 length:975 start_codon:yes stop_codon:yes gene_type:complete
MLISLVFSFWNEEDVFDELIQRVVSTLHGIDCDYELIFVNDCSTDGSLEILKSHAATNPNIKIINMSRRFGRSPCVMAGFRFSKGDIVIYMDADLQDPPELIPEMVALYRNGADTVHTVRVERKGESKVKLLVTKIAYRVVNRLSDIQLIENAGDFKLMRRRVVDEVIKFGEYQPYTRGLIPWIGFRQETINYVRDARFAGKTKYSLFRSRSIEGPYTEFIKGFTAFSEIPLYVSLIFGLFTAMASFGYLIFIVIYKSLGMSIPGWAAIMAVMLLIGGVTLFTNGVMGIYIGRIFNNVKGRPAYIVDSTLGFDGNETKPIATPD